MKTQNLLKIVTLVNVLISAGYAVAGILNPGYINPHNLNPSKASEIMALYGGARSVPLLLIVLFVIIKPKVNSIQTLALLACIIQFADGFIGLYQQDPAKSVGPFIICVITIFAVYLNHRVKNTVVA